MSDFIVENIEPNSQKYKAEKKARDSKDKLKPVVGKDSIVSTKKSSWSKLLDRFIEKDLPDFKEWVIFDILIPTIQDTLMDTMEMMFYGEIDRRGRRSSRGSSSHRTNYASCYRNRSESRRRSRRDNDDYYDHDEKIDYRDIRLRSRVDAENIVDAMRSRIENSGSASVADLLDLAGLPGRYTDNNWGWDREEDIGIKRVNSGFLIDVTEAKYLE